MIAGKVANVLASDYPASLLELIVASDGSEDATVEVARRAGATHRARPAAHRQAVGAQPGRAGVLGRDPGLHRRRLPVRARNAAPPGVQLRRRAGRRCGGQRDPLRRGARPTGRARRGPVLALRAPPQATRGPGRERRLGQRPPVRRAPQSVHRPDAERGYRRLPDLEPGCQGGQPAGLRRAGGRPRRDPRGGRYRAAPQGPRDEPRAALGARAR